MSVPLSVHLMNEGVDYPREKQLVPELTQTRTNWKMVLLQETFLGSDDDDDDMEHVKT